MTAPDHRGNVSFLQRGARRVPHSGQNLACGGFSCWHRGHFMRAVPRGLDVTYAVMKRLLDYPQADSQDMTYPAAVPMLLPAMLTYRNETFNSRHAYLNF